MRNLSRYADSVPVFLLVAGFILIGIGWNGAASLDYTQGQIPYLISGGLTGLGLVFFGCSSLLIRAIKKEQAAQTEVLREQTEILRRVSSVMTFGSNGASQANGKMVIAGASSFHSPTCRLVEGREEMTQIPKTEAEDSGLTACRICIP